MSDNPNTDETPQPILTAEDAPDSFVATDEDLSEGSSSGSVRAFSADMSQAALTRINQYRALAGVGAATMNLALKAAADAHVLYYLQNAPVSGSIHDEVEGKPSFSGKDFFTRAAAFGYANSQSTNENIDTISDPVAAVNRLMATLNHRIPILDPAYPEVGIGAGEGDGGKTPITVIDFGMPVWKNSFQPQFIIWPPENGLNFFKSYGGEGPDLFKRAGLTPSYPIGCPISMTYRGAGKIVYDTNGMSLIDARGNQVECYKVADLNSFWTARNSATIAATKSLSPNTTYQVTFTYKIDNGAPQVRSWKFSTGATLADVNVSTEPRAGLANADSSVKTLWQGVDGPVAAGTAKRTWLYGPDIFDARYEPYVEAPAGKRVVFYFDKARLEINNPNGDRSSQWFVTSGLLVRELVSGNMQLGDNSYQQKGAAQIPVAGDPGPVNPDAPTYATFGGVASLNNDRRAPQRVRQPVLETLAKDGTVSTPAPAPAVAKYSYYDNTLGHNVPDVLMKYMNTLPNGWVFVLGLPISEAYWIKVKLAGQDRDVLVQMFERRAITFTPSNPPDWQVEMGNIGRHYFSWRYGA